jgi:hypothetical protein
MKNRVLYTAIGAGIAGVIGTAEQQTDVTVRYENGM